MERHSPWRRCARSRKNRTTPLARLQNLMSMLMMMCLWLGCGTPRDHRAACPAIEVTAVEDLQTDSTMPVALNDSTNISLTRTPLVTSADVTGADASLTEGQWVLNLDLTDEAATRVQNFSNRHLGRTMAFLANGTIRSLPRIKDPITGKGFLIGGFSQADAKRLASAIRYGCKR